MKRLSTLYSYFGARYYDSDLSVWLSVDPMSDMYPHQSPYMYCSGNPVMRIDPTGMNDGNFITEGGTVLGNDGIDDGKVYVVTDKKFIKEQSKSGGSWSTEKMTSDQYYELPSFDDRQTIKGIVEGNEQNDVVEVGGRGLINKEGGVTHIRSEDGRAAQPSDDRATIRLKSVHSSEIDKLGLIPPTYETSYTWHSHPDGAWVLDPASNTWLSQGEFIKRYPGASLSSYVNRSFDVGPSDIDISVSDCNRNFVISTIDKRVYFYNSDGTRGNSISFDTFFNIK
ncbi:MAG: RHS repeat-associated core domain-containing protein [Bacteroidales bacterium]